MVALTDNTTVVAYIRNQGGTHSRQLTGDMLLWANVHGIELQARHVPGRLNCRTDQLSRAGSLLPGEWFQNPHVCCRSWRILGKPLVDLFTTKISIDWISSSPRYLMFWLWALTICHKRGMACKHTLTLPTPLMTRILSKIDSSDNLNVILLAPNWPAQLWFPPPTGPTSRTSTSSPSHSLSARARFLPFTRSWRDCSYMCGCCQGIL